MSGSGILSAIASGFGQGAQAYGTAMQREAEQKERERQQFALLNARQDDTQENMRLKAELAAAKAGGGKAIADPRALATAPEYDEFRAAAGGGTVAQEQAARAIRQGGAAVSDTEMGPAPAGRDGKEGYRPGQAQALLSKARSNLFAAVGLADPGHADDLQKSLTEEQNRKNVDAYKGGDNRAGSAALLGQGKDPYASNGTNSVTGSAGTGTLAEAQRAEAFGKANQANADAKQTREGSGTANNVAKTFAGEDGYMVVQYRSGKTERMMIDGKPVRSMEWSKRLDKVDADLAKTMDGKFLTPEERRKQATQLAISGGGGDPAPAAAPAPVQAVPREKHAATIEEAKRVMKLGADRNKVLERLKAAGVPTDGL